MQNFKGDSTELKMQSVADPVFDLVDASLDDFYAGGFDASPFLLAMYDDGRMPFSQRIKRDSFVEFIRQALVNFPFTGTFEVYLSILTSIFGSNSEIRLYPGEGTLEIDIEAAANSESEFIGRELVGSTYSFFDMIDSDGDTLIFRGISGIDTEYELNLLFAEMMPIGIVPQITLGFYEISDWADDDGDYMVDDDDLGIIFVEGGA